MDTLTSLIEQYDATYKEIQHLQSVFSKGLILNEGLMANLGKAWNVFRQDSRFNKYTNQIQKATKADDEKIKLALDIVKRKLQSRQKALDDIQAKIESHGDKDLVAKLNQAMTDNKKQAQTFITAADTLMNTIYPSKTVAPTPTPAAPAATPAPAPAASPAAPAATTKKPSGRRTSKKATTPPVSQKDADKDMDTQTADPNQRGSDKENPEFEESVKK